MSFYLSRKIIRKLPGKVIKLVKLPEYNLISGFSSREQVGVICKKYGYKSVMLITDVTIEKLGFQNKIIESLKENDINYHVFSNISSEPTIDIVIEGKEEAVKCHAECIIALGGGSVLDSTKIISAYALCPKKRASHYTTKFVFAKTLPIISIPTTAGTGAEVTVGAVVKNKKGTKKSSVLTKLKITDVILDSELTINAPKSITIGCGIDALSHGLEGCLADIKSSDEDLNKSRECVKLALENIPILLNEPNNIEARQNMCLAANYGGNAINKQLAGYVHAFAHSIGAIYHLPHGIAIAKSLLPVVEFHKDKCIDDLASLAVYCGLSDNEPKEVARDKFLLKLKELLELCGLNDGISELSLKDYKTLVKMINSDSINYSAPKTLSNKEILNLLDKIKGETR